MSGIRRKRDGHTSELRESLLAGEVSVNIGDDDGGGGGGGGDYRNGSRHKPPSSSSSSCCSTWLGRCLCCWCCGMCSSSSGGSSSSSGSNSNSNSVYPTIPKEDTSRFLTDFFEYYEKKGLFCILVDRITRNVKWIFCAFFFAFFAYAIDYPSLSRRLANTDCPSFLGSHVSSPTLNEASLTTSDCYGDHPISLERMAHPDDFGLLCYSIFTLWLVYDILSFVLHLPARIRVRRVYDQFFGSGKGDTKLAETEWPKIVRFLQEAQKTTAATAQTIDEQATGFMEGFGPKISELDVANVITRKANFHTAIYNQKCIHDSLQLPCLGFRNYFPLQLQMNLFACIDWVVFDGDEVRKEIRELKGKTQDDMNTMYWKIQLCFVFLGLVNLLLSPFILCLRTMYFIFEESDRLTKHPGARTWSQHAMWELREFNELEYHFKRRLAAATRPSTEYMGMFSSRGYVLVARFLSFIGSGIVVALSILGFFYDEEFLTAPLIEDRSTIWIIGVIGVLIAVAQAFIPDDNLEIAHKKKLREIFEHTRYQKMDVEGQGDWKNNEMAFETRDEFCSLFQYKAQLFLEEVLGVVLVPYILIFYLPGEAANIVKFFNKYTSKTKIPENAGSICVFAEFKDPGTSQRSIKAKTEYSLLTFENLYKDWVPGEETQDYLDRIKQQQGDIEWGLYSNVMPPTARPRFHTPTAQTGL